MVFLVRRLGQPCCLPVLQMHSSSVESEEYGLLKDMGVVLEAQPGETFGECSQVNGLH